MRFAGDVSIFLRARTIEIPITEKNSEGNLIAGPRNSPKNHLENLDEMKTSLRKEIMSIRSKILADNQKEPIALPLSGRTILYPLFGKRIISLGCQYFEAQNRLNDFVTSRRSILEWILLALDHSVTPHCLSVMAYLNTHDTASSRLNDENRKKVFHLALTKTIFGIFVWFVMNNIVRESCTVRQEIKWS